jgi:hypothetical protein
MRHEEKQYRDVVACDWRIFKISYTAHAFWHQGQGPYEAKDKVDHHGEVVDLETKSCHGHACIRL